MINLIQDTNIYLNYIFDIPITTKKSLSNIFKSFECKVLIFIFAFLKNNKTK